MKKINTLFLIFCGLNVFAGNTNTFWNFSSDKLIAVDGKRTIVPTTYRLAQLDVNAFRLSQAFIPNEYSGLNADMMLPTPEGNLMAFSVFESSMMEEPLASKYAQIKTYTAISKENPMITAKLDFTVWGFHAMVFNGENTYFIDPYSNMNSEWYVVYFKHDYAKPLNQRMHCDVDDSKEPILSKQDAIRLEDRELPKLSFKTSGDTLRNYRLALACTVEYAAAVGGATPTKASVLSAMVTSMNRVNGVFEREFSMHATLIGNDDTLIYLTSDPYTNNSGPTMLGENQSNITAIIGSANYDYGHVFSTGGGGIASLGCVCGNIKAQGVTGSSNPVGDSYDIDYVAHEMGHQFGGNHTFNSVTGSCSGNRSGSSAFEIGSATTIQGYAGICGSDDIQPHSDDYYHIRSLEEMTGNTIKACAAKTISNNAPPVLTSINKTYIIPYKTPFELTATATDANNDPLTYCWEQYNKGGSGAAWNLQYATTTPTFRSFNPAASGTRIFPAYIQLIQNTETYLGELLPDTNRILKFRCTVRDMHNGHGAFYTSIDTTKLDVRSTAPNLFRVTSQNTTGQSWNGFSNQTVTWNKAGTDMAPVSCANVDIYLSIDSGKTWPYLLASATPNDGSQSVSVPNPSADITWARIKVKGNGNVFFDLNDNWIAIKKFVAPAGTDDIEKSNFVLYPNPNHGEFSIELPEAIQTGNLEIINAVGAIVYSKQVKSKEHLTISILSKGIYLVKLSTNSTQTRTQKIVVE